MCVVFILAFYLNTGLYPDPHRKCTEFSHAPFALIALVSLLTELALIVQNDNLRFIPTEPRSVPRATEGRPYSLLHTHNLCKIGRAHV